MPGTPLSPFATPLYVMAKPVSDSCNLHCHYCYYLSERRFPEGGGHKRKLMGEELLEEFIRQYIEAQTQEDVLFCWHGGEPLLRPLSFYKKALSLEHRYARGHRIANSIQTNGTLLTDEWAEFLAENRWLVGVSIDGPREYHDEFRLTRQGRPSWAKVMRGIRLLRKHGAEWNAMAVVNALNAPHPLDFYHFFRDELDCPFLQFTPIVEKGLDCNVEASAWGEFLCAVFDEWVSHDVGQMFVQLFDSTLASWVGQPPSLCSMATYCGHAAVLEADGTLYSCDHFATPPHRLGNILSTPLTQLVYSEQQTAFGRAKRDTLCDDCRACPWLFACNGECPKNRGEDGRNVLCQGYRRFFAHTAPAMRRMRDLLAEGLPPADIMKERPIKGG